MTHSSHSRGLRRFDRQLTQLRRAFPRFAPQIAALTAPHNMAVRVPLAFALIFGGLVGFLPIFGFWMLPLGLILLAIDIPKLRPTVSTLAVRSRAILRRFRR